MTKTKKIIEDIEDVEEQENMIAVRFDDKGIAVKGDVDETKHVQGILAMISSLIDRCGGDATCVNKVISSIHADEEEKEDKNIKVIKTSSLEDLIDILKKEITSKKDED